MTAERIGIDTGGTFTDFVWIDQVGSPRQHKVLSTPQDPAEAVISGICEMSVGNEANVVHGSTVATNALLERKGARTALITTTGFADVLAIGRQDRPDLYALVPRKPPPLVPKKWRFEISERVNSQGKITKQLDLEELVPIWDQLIEAEIESVAVCLLFSFLQPEHEQKIADRLHELLAEHNGIVERERRVDISISLSSVVLPEFREYERTSTTVINAYVTPVMGSYLSRLQEGIAPRPLSIMQSSGGVTSVKVASAQAARTVLSGPAGGVVGARHISSLAGFSDIITFDMGGTSTDVALCEGQLPLSGEGEIAGQPLRLPMIDIHTVGAGGGSIASIDAGGALVVGPESAGAYPGPACYPRELVDQSSSTQAQQQPRPTTTDANLVLGRLDADRFLGGAIKLDAERAKSAISDLIRPGGSSSVHELAWDVIQVANAAMERAIRKISVERGHDPRRFTLVAFGGAGPLHACDLAAELSIPRVIVPVSPGVLSAMGMLVSSQIRDYSKTIMAPLDETDLIGTDWLQDHFNQLQETALLEFSQGNKPPIHLDFREALDMRYRGQSHELRLNILPENQSIPLSQQFHEIHQRRYGYSLAGTEVEIVHIRLAAVQEVEPPTLPTLEAGASDAEPALVGRKPVWFGSGLQDTDLYDRNRLMAGNQFSGPAVVFQYDTTTVVPPEWAAEVDAVGNLVLVMR